jgi:uncharacterized membrane protein YidH (DUF202 family)
MNNKLLGIILIILGTTLCLWGYDVYNSAGSQVERAFSGDTPIEAWLGLIGGAICLVIGIFRLK